MILYVVKFPLEELPLSKSSTYGFGKEYGEKLEHLDANAKFIEWDKMKPLTMPELDLLKMNAHTYLEHVMNALKR